MIISAFLPQPDEQATLSIVAEQLDQLGDDAVLYLHLPGQTAPMAVSPVLAQLLRHSVRELGEGHAVTLIPTQQELSTFEAAQLLGVSRPFLITHLLDTGDLPHRKVGTHRRLALADVLAYREDRERRLAIADELTAQTQALGLY